MHITTGKQDNFINDLFLNFICIQLSNIYFKEKNCESILSSVNYFDVFRGETQKSHNNCLIPRLQLDNLIVVIRRR